MYKTTGSCRLRRSGSPRGPWDGRLLHLMLDAKSCSHSQSCHAVKMLAQIDSVREGKELK